MDIISSSVDKGRITLRVLDICESEHEQSERGHEQLGRARVHAGRHGQSTYTTRVQILRTYERTMSGRPDVRYHDNHNDYA